MAGGLAMLPGARRIPVPPRRTRQQCRSGSWQTCSYAEFIVGLPRDTSGGPNLQLFLFFSFRKGIMIPDAKKESIDCVG